MLLVLINSDPQNNTQNKKLEKIIWLYSAKKNKAKDIEEYSTL